MNQFTKDELFSMESTIKSMRIYSEIDTWDEELLIKIQFLIDNYCEHELSAGCFSCAGMLPIACDKCNREFE